jgi:HSP20 family molecular chaperone IbpA
MMLRTGLFGEPYLDDFFHDVTEPTRFYTSDRNVMRTDLQESDDGYELGIELPGYKKEDVQAELKDGMLIISAKHESQNEDKDKRFVRRERFYGTCSRSFYVGDEVKQEDIRAKFEDGILKLYIPKKKDVPHVETPNYISIEG